MKRTLTILGLWAVATGCQAQEQDIYRSIPAWVKIDKAALEPPHPAVSTELPAFSQSHPQRAWLENPLAHHSRFNAMPPPAPLAQSSLPGPGYSQDLDAAHSEAMRPSVNLASAWRLSVPNIRRNVAKVQLNRSF
jgi:hypothetical protein